MDVENLQILEVRINSRDEKLTPDGYDIKYIAKLLEDVENILYPNTKKNRPVISYDIGPGSVRHYFKTATEVIIGVGAILNQVQAEQSINFMQSRSARAVQNIQEIARKKDYVIQFKTSLEKDYQLTITPHTNYYVKDVTWVDTEMYVYGILRDAGGKGKVNIHLDTREYGYIAIKTREDFLKDQRENLLYKEFGVRVTVKQNVRSGEIDTKSFKLIDLIDYTQESDEDYLNNLIKKATPKWQGVKVEEWLNDLRGNNG